MSKEQNNEKENKALHIADVSKFDWQHFLDYVNSYDLKKSADDKVDTIVKDLLYGIGVLKMCVNTYVGHLILNDA